MSNVRWAAIGAAVAVVLGAGGVSLTQAALGTGDRSVFVAITPCRLIDTRGGVGPRDVPLGPADTLTLQVTGSTGECSDIPAGATAAALNVTAIQGSTRSYLTIYPADAGQPNASNLNWNGGDPPTPNKVDVKLSSGGAVDITNNAGTVHVAADLVGYYTDHHHDDQYHTKHQVEAGLAQKANTSTVYTRSQLYTKAQIDSTRNVSQTFLGVDGAIAGNQPLTLAAGCSAIADGSVDLLLPLTVPVGSTVTGVAARVLDGADPSVGYSLVLELWKQSITGFSEETRRQFAGGTASGPTNVDLTPAPITIAAGDVLVVTMTSEQPGTDAERNALCSVTVDFTLPGP